MSRLARILASTCIVSCLGGVLRAEEPAPAKAPEAPAKSAEEAAPRPKPEHCWGGCKASAVHTMARAGCPQHVAWYARPAISCSYVGYYVGGGTACGGCGPGPEEGTWGWDFRGHIIPRKVRLDWSHWRYQGGPGDYKVDKGPEVPDLPALLNPDLYRSKHHQKAEEHE